MKRNPKKSRRNPETLRVWTLDQARAASPYIASIARSLREHVLAGLVARIDAERGLSLLASACRVRALRWASARG